MRQRLTDKDIEKIKQEIEHRKLVVRKEAIAAVKEAREHGDLSENFEYYAAKKDKNRNESRIRYLDRMLKTAEVVEDNSSEDEVGLNNIITVHFEEEDEEETFKLVTSIRGNSLKGMISIESPIGKAVQKRRVGDRVLVQMERTGGYYIKIVRIEKTDDEESDTIRNY